MLWRAGFPELGAHPRFLRVGVFSSACSRRTITFVCISGVNAKEAELKFHSRLSFTLSYLLSHPEQDHRIYGRAHDELARAAPAEHRVRLHLPTELL